MDVGLILLILGVIFNVFLGTLVALKYQDRAARALVLVAIGLIEWEVANYMADTSLNPLLWNRLTFIGPLIVVVASLLFVIELRGRKLGSATAKAIIIGSVLVGLACLTQLVVPAVVPRVVGGVVQGYDPVRGVGYPIYLVWVGGLIIVHMANVFSRVKGESAVLKIQMQLVRLGTIGALAIPLVTNVILPNMVNSSASAKFVPLMSIIYMGALSIAILKHKMLNIRDFLLRAVGFSVTTLVLGMLYIAPGVLLIVWALGIQFNFPSILFATFIGTLLAINFARIQAWLVRRSNQIFFRESYEPTELMAKLNQALIPATNIHKILASTSNIINRSLKSEFCAFIIEPNTEGGEYAFYGASSKETEGRLMRALPLFRAHAKRAVFVVDEYSDSTVRNKLRDDDIAIVIRLAVTNIQGEDKTAIGYMVVGTRKSGKAYGMQDVRVLQTVSSTIAIAAQDALHFEEIQAFNATLQKKVDEATTELRTNNRKLQELDESKDEFISMASHQLRTPLTTVKGYISMLLDGDLGEITPQQRRVLEEAFGSSQRMVYLIGDFLNVSRLQTGKFELESHEFDMAEVVRQEVRQMEDNARVRKMKLDYQCPSGPILVSLDENKIRQVIMNFLDNAIFYSVQGGTIQVVLTKHLSHISLRVTDHGIGVPASERHKLFSKFFRATNAKKQRPDGTGIGLFMARKVIVAHGGTIIFETAEGKGSTFGFRLPIKR